MEKKEPSTSESIPEPNPYENPYAVWFSKDYFSQPSAVALGANPLD